MSKKLCSVVFFISFIYPCFSAMLRNIQLKEIKIAIWITIDAFSITHKFYSLPVSASYQFMFLGV